MSWNSWAAATSPATTVAVGPLTTATDNRPDHASRRASTWSAGSATEIIAPCPASARIAFDRSATTFAPSSRDSAPATTAAAISPCEWPTTAVGSTPNEYQRRARDTITAHRTGWMTSTRSSHPSSGPPSTSVSDQSTWGSRAAAHSVIRAANTGE